MRPDLPNCLRSVAIDLGLQGSQYATLVALLREAADELERPRETSPSVCASPSADFVYDGDGAPAVGRVCFNCED
jgi:hypothetical protein